MLFAPKTYRETRIETIKQVREAIFIETERLAVQQQLDRKKTREERNRLGQFATPTKLATDILDYASLLLPPGRDIYFLDPALGTGSFISALFRSFPADQIKEVVGFEIDSQYAQYTLSLWEDKRLQLHIADFTQALPPDQEAKKFNLLICNPPYVRHHHLLREDKQRLRKSVEESLGMRVNERSGLYCYFLWIAHQWLAKGGLAGWLIPSEFMSVNYGQQLRRYLLDQVTLLRVHCFDPADVQFDDALVSSSVIWFKNVPPPAEHVIEFTYGGTLKEPALSSLLPISILSKKKKWMTFPLISSLKETTQYDTMPGDVVHLTNSSANYKKSTSEESRFYFKASPRQSLAQERFRLSDLFDIKRGLATGANSFFLLTPEQISEYQIPAEFLTPVLPHSRHILNEEVEADSKGNPLLERKLFLLTCDLPEKVLESTYPSLWRYFQTGIAKGINKGYLCSHRTPWYSQEKRPASLFVCCYMGRQKTSESLPFRFILNRSKAVATNSYYVLYPRLYLQKALQEEPTLITALWQTLKGISLNNFLSESRVYGGGLHKMEPRELAHTSIDELPEVLLELLNIHCQIHDLWS
ncbi:MAG: N-6 DNA methylase [Ktedonobacteraceae bacterium]|nr:N-6 DNA methylase [Ktedonobacteraceae bacterium]